MAHIAVMEISDDVARTTSLQHSLWRLLIRCCKRRRFYNVVQRLHRNYLATSKWRWIATSQQRCNNVIESTGSICKMIYATGMYLRLLNTGFIYGDIMYEKCLSNKSIYYKNSNKRSRCLLQF